MPPVKVQAYVGALLPQLVTLAEGAIEPGIQMVDTGFSITVGGFFTVTVLVVINVPQGLVNASVIVYVPDSVNRNEGFTELAFVPFVKLQAGVVPQNPVAYVTDHRYVNSEQLFVITEVFVAFTFKGEQPAALSILNDGTGGAAIHTCFVKTEGPHGFDEVSVTV